MNRMTREEYSAYLDKVGVPADKKERWLTIYDQRVKNLDNARSEEEKRMRELELAQWTQGIGIPLATGAAAWLGGELVGGPTAAIATPKILYAGKVAADAAGAGASAAGAGAGGTTAGTAGTAAGLGSTLAPIAGALLAAEVGTQSWEGINKILDGKDLSFREQAALALPTFGLSFLYNPIFGGHKSTKQIQAERMQDLLEKNYTGVSDWYQTTHDPNFKQTIDLPPNTQFEETRDEKYLRPEDIWSSPDVIELGGNDYFSTWSEEQRRQLSDALLKEQLIREKKGGIYVTDMERARELADALRAGKLAEILMQSQPPGAATSSVEAVKPITTQNPYKPLGNSGIQYR